jgi:uncharacterized Zn-finger protein
MSKDKQACTASTYQVTYDDLPLSCPMDSMRVWDAHPKVYLPIETLGEAVCPYCDARFVLKNFKGRNPKESTPADTEGY